jgi:hypothetical protein
MLRLRVAKHAFLAQDGDPRIHRAQLSLDQFLTAHVQFEFDVVLRRRVDLLRRTQIATH